MARPRPTQVTALAEDPWTWSPSSSRRGSPPTPVHRDDRCRRQRARLPSAEAPRARSGRSSSRGARSRRSCRTGPPASAPAASPARPRPTLVGHSAAGLGDGRRLKSTASRRVAERGEHLGEDADRATQLQRPAGPLRQVPPAWRGTYPAHRGSSRSPMGPATSSRGARSDPPAPVGGSRSVIAGASSARRHPRQQRVESMLQEEGLEVATGAIEAAPVTNGVDPQAVAAVSSSVLAARSISARIWTLSLRARRRRPRRSPPVPTRPPRFRELLRSGRPRAPTAFRRGGGRELRTAASAAASIIPTQVAAVASHRAKTMAPWRARRAHPHRSNGAS